MSSKKNFLYGILLIIAFLFLSGFLFFPSTAYAIWPFDFGGFAAIVDQTCIGGEYVWVAGPAPGEYFFVWGVSALKDGGPPRVEWNIVLGKSFANPIVCCHGGFCFPDETGFMVTPNAGIPYSGF